jgi:predicted phosphodiesterase
MRVFAVSDIHVDYPSNLAWVESLSHSDYRDDVLILAGDVTDSLPLLGRVFRILRQCFHAVLFVPGNHDLWVVRDDPQLSSFDKLEQVRRTAQDHGICMETFTHDSVSIVPLFSWYDYSFGQPTLELEQSWMDYRACRWPDGLAPNDVHRHLAGTTDLDRTQLAPTVISFSHFLPRHDLIPSYIPARLRYLDPVLGASSLDRQIRAVGSTLHVYGHSHVNRRVRLDGIDYINNAYGYPHESWLHSKGLLCIHH